MSDALLTAPRASGAGRLIDAALDGAAAVYARSAAGFGAAILAAYVLIVMASAVVLPQANWDMMPYLAVAEENAYPDVIALHDFAYGAVEAGVPADQYQALVKGNPYRERMAADPAAFHSMLPMYRVKALYAETVSALSSVMPPVAAVRAVSLASALAFGLICLAWLRHERALALAPLLVGVLIVSDFAGMVRAGTPDLMASALLLGGAFAMRCRREGLTALLFFLAFLARPDNIVFLAALGVLLAMARTWSWGAFASLALSLAVYAPLSAWAGHFGWWTHLYFSSVEQQLTMDGFHPAFSLVLYVKALVLSAVRALTWNSWAGVALLAAGGWLALDRAGFRLDRRAAALAGALMLGTVGKFLVFPIHDTRIYYPNLIPPFLLLAPLMLALWQGRASRANGAAA